MESIPRVDKSTKRPQPCIWMRAGVVSRKFCNIDYDCTSCRFDKLLRAIAEENDRLRESGILAKGKRGKIGSWKERLRALPPTKRPCVHHMKGRIQFRGCTNDYRCGNCDFDQYFHDQYVVHAVVQPVDVMDIKGFRVPQGYYFHRGHTWMKLEEGSSVRVGIDEFALRLLGPFDRIEAPLVGKEVKQDHPEIRVSRGVHLGKVLSPVSGVVTAINPKLREEGHLANKDPYCEGWVMNLHSTNLRRELKHLMISKQSEDFVSGEVERLHDVIEEVAGPLATDGGHLADDIFGHMPQLGWERLTRSFLHTG